MPEPIWPAPMTPTVLMSTTGSIPQSGCRFLWQLS